MGNNKSKHKQEKADGVIMMKETNIPFLIIEAKKPDVKEKEKRVDLKKLTLNLKASWKGRKYQIPLFGVQIFINLFIIRICLCLKTCFIVSK